MVKEGEDELRQRRKDGINLEEMPFVVIAINGMMATATVVVEAVYKP